MSRNRQVSFIYVLRNARCKGCGATVGLARDWLGLVWRDALGRHHCWACEVCDYSGAPSDHDFHALFAA